MRLLTQNIMGTPAMKMARVTHDFEHVQDFEATVMGFQEIKWPWYWVALTRAFKQSDYGRYPRVFKGAISAQPIVWDKRVLKAVRRQVRILHGGSRFTLPRYQRAVLLEEIATGNKFWVKNKHYLPGYTGRALLARRRIGSTARKNDKRFTEDLLETGFPVFDIGDYNERGAVFGGGHTYLAKNSIDQVILSQPAGGKRASSVDPGKTGVLSNDHMFTDHDGHWVDFTLQDR